MADETQTVGMVMIDAEDYAKRMYARVLSQWTLDLLEVRRQGWNIPSRRRGSEDGCGLTIPFAPAGSDQPLARGCERLLWWRAGKQAA